MGDLNTDPIIVNIGRNAPSAQATGYSKPEQGGAGATLKLFVNCEQKKIRVNLSMCCPLSNQRRILQLHLEP